MRLLLASLLLLSLPVQGSEVRVGSASININPPNGTPLAGYYSTRGSEGILDPIFSRAVVIQTGETVAALVVCDLLSLPRHTVEAARALIEKNTAIPGTNVMISATHQHTGPVIARESSRDKLDGGDSELGRQYTENLPALIAQSVADAAAKLAPAKLSAAREEEGQLAYNRRFWMKDGTVSWNPRKRDPNIIRPAGPIDPDVFVLYFESEKNKPLVTYVNYAMHPDTTGGKLISADFPGELARRLADYKGPDMLTIFANGACGNLNHRDIHWTAPQSSPAEAKRLGTILAASVLKSYPRLNDIDPGQLRITSRLLDLPLPEISDQDLRQAREVIAHLHDGKSTFLQQVKAFQVIDVHERKGVPFQVEAQVIALGDEVAWVSLPGEIFVELGLSIKQASPFKYTLIAELANGAIGYIPNKTAYTEGNYEVISARCAEGSGEMLVTAAIEMLEQLHGSR